MNEDNHLEERFCDEWPTGTSPILMIPFDCIWEKRNGKRVLYKKAGSVVLFSELNSLLQKGMNLSFEKKVHTPWFYQGQTLLSQLKVYHEQDTPSPKELQKWRIDTLNWMNNFVFRLKEDISFIDFCFLCEQMFGFSDETLKARFIQFPLEIQTKNFVAACTGTLLALSLGYADLGFLRELFKVYMFFDLPISSQIWSNEEKELLVRHWRGEVKADELHDHEAFMQRYKGEDDFYLNLKSKALTKYLSWSFEDIRGEGYFKGVKACEMSDLDCLSLLIYHYNPTINELTDDLELSVLDVINNQNEEFKNRFFAKRLERMLFLSFQKAKAKDDDYIELAGL